MGNIISDFIGRGKKPKTSGRTVLVLTPLGKIKAEKSDLPGNKFRILSALWESGPSTIHELSEELGMHEDRVKSIAKDLMATGYVKRSGSTE